MWCIFTLTMLEMAQSFPDKVRMQLFTHFKGAFIVDCNTAALPMYKCSKFCKKSFLEFLETNMDNYRYWDKIFFLNNKIGLKSLKKWYIPNLM